jgi:hypothetical protein
MSDIYDSVRTAITKLREAGFPERSKQLYDVMRAGSTPTEVLMGVRWTLGRILDEEPGLPASARDYVVSLHEEISGLLEGR